VIKVIRYNQRVKELTTEQIFAEIDKDGDGEIDEAELTAWLEAADKELKPFKPPAAEEPEADEKKEEDEEKKEDGKAEEAKEGEAKEGEAAEKLTEAAAEKEKITPAPKAGLVRPTALSPEVPEKEPEPELIELDSDKLDEVFLKLCDEGESSLSKAVFCRTVQQFFKVIKETALIDVFPVTTSKPQRKLDTREVVEVLEGPVRDTLTKVTRVKCRAVRDNVEGWATVSSNLGTVFLREGKPSFKVVKETILTEEFQLEPEGKKEGEEEKNEEKKPDGKKLKLGEVLIVLEWPRKEEKSGLVRMKAKVKSDGSAGWVTIMGNQGTVFAEMLP